MHALHGLQDLLSVGVNVSVTTHLVYQVLRYTIVVAAGYSVFVCNSGQGMAQHTMPCHTALLCVQSTFQAECATAFLRSSETPP